jgi:hypothetical protein
MFDELVNRCLRLSNYISKTDPIVIIRGKTWKKTKGGRFIYTPIFLDEILNLNA